jgi:hypothetical protein
MTHAPLIARSSPHTDRQHDGMRSGRRWRPPHASVAIFTRRASTPARASTITQHSHADVVGSLGGRTAEMAPTDTMGSPR